MLSNLNGLGLTYNIQIRAKLLGILPIVLACGYSISYFPDKSASAPIAKGLTVNLLFTYRVLITYLVVVKRDSYL